METFPIILVAVLALCLMPSALALKCHVCGSVPGFSFGSKCGSDVAEGSATCDPRADRCMTVKGTINDPDAGKYSFEIKNCSSIFVCEPGSPLYMCNLFNATGMMTKCSTECCEGDLCNGVGGAVRMSGLVASFAAILLALILNLFPGVY